MFSKLNLRGFSENKNIVASYIAQFYFMLVSLLAVTGYILYSSNIYILSPLLLLKNIPNIPIFNGPVDYAIAFALFGVINGLVYYIYGNRQAFIHKYSKVMAMLAIFNFVATIWGLSLPVAASSLSGLNIFSMFLLQLSIIAVMEFIVYLTKK